MACCVQSLSDGDPGGPLQERRRGARSVAAVLCAASVCVHTFEGRAVPGRFGP